jgi:hypothetical protein
MEYLLFEIEELSENKKYLWRFFFVGMQPIRGYRGIEFSRFTCQPFTKLDLQFTFLLHVFLFHFFFFFSGINRCCVEQWVCTVTYIEGVPACSSLEPAHNDSKPPIQWIFLKPLTKELWLATVCFIFFTGFVFWTIERSINPVFQGSSLAQFSTALYFVFSTFTFSHGQQLELKLPDNI